MQTKICKDCKYQSGSGAYAYGPFCFHPKSMSIDIIGGVTHYNSCNVMRHFKTDCGKSGALFVPKPPSRWKRFWTWLTSDR